MHFKLSSHELFELSRSTNSDALNRFAINYFFLNDQEAIGKYADYFLRHDETRTTFLYYSGQPINSECFSGGEIQINDFPILKKYFRQHGLNFYEHVDLTALGSTLQYNVNLAAETAKNTPNDKATAHALSKNHLSSRSRARDVKVVGITKIKNEGNLAALAVQQWLRFCDHIIISDASDIDWAVKTSDFSSAVTTIKQITPFKENLVYDQLYSAAREKKATHILHFDVDEVLAPDVSYSDFFDQISRLEIGESLAVKWAQLFSKGRNFFEFNYDEAFQDISFHRLLPQHKDLIFCDDGKSTHADLSLHCPTIPENFPKKRFLSDFTLLHFEGINISHQIQKYNYYYQRDYALNLEPELALRRYLPKLLQLLEVLKSSAFFTPVSEKTHALIKTYIQEFNLKTVATTSEEKLQLPEIFENFKIEI